MRALIRRTAPVLVAVASSLATLALFDLVSYAALPTGLAARFHPYRCPDCAPPPAAGRLSDDPRGYYVARDERGFDIAPNRTGDVDYVDGTLYPIWSNSLGCFDTERKVEGRYVYLAGDSFAWGYTPFRDKFGTLLERKLGLPVLKCGVPHTGQSHQLSKMREVVAAVGQRPALLVDT